MIGHLSPNGYRVIRLNGNPGVQTWHTVHSLVAAAFLGSRPEGHQINHKDGSKENNCLSNLEYVTLAENHRHAAATGLKATGGRHGARLHPETRPRGIDNGRATFTEDDIRSMRARHARGVSMAQLAREYGRATTVISRIIRRLAWAHVS